MKMERRDAFALTALIAFVVAVYVIGTVVFGEPFLGYR